jgi:hypothetical protein
VTIEREMEAIEDAAVVAWYWTRRWWEPRDWRKVPHGKKGFCRLLAWAVLATLKRRVEMSVTQDTKLATAKATLKRVCNTWTYDGFNVGSRVSEDEYDQLAYAVVDALDELAAQSGQTTTAAAKAPTKTKG